MVKLKAFEKFETTTDALAAATALVDSKLSKCEFFFFFFFFFFFSAPHASRRPSPSFSAAFASTPTSRPRRPRRMLSECEVAYQPYLDTG